MSGEFGEKCRSFECSSQLWSDRGVTQYVERRKILLLAGVGENTLRPRVQEVPRPKLLHSPEFQRLAYGIYGTRDQSPSADEAWEQNLRVLLLRSGSDSGIGLRSAARLHRLDGFKENEALETISKNAHHSRSDRVHRSRTLKVDDFTVVDGFRVTTVGRTLLDLGRVASANQIEFALESALRGPDPGTPRSWNDSLLAELTDRAIGSRPRTGAKQLRFVLARRPPETVPTGSFAETSWLQGVRMYGLGGIERQPEIRYFDPNGSLMRRFFPDFGEIERLFLVDVNGRESRNGATMTEADVRRLNVLSRVFRVHVVSGSDAVNHPKRSGSEVASLILNTPVVSFPATINGHRLVRTPTGLDIFA